MTASQFQHDIAVVGRIPSVPVILDVICRITGMGFAAVARVTEDRWIACQVKDDIGFGLKPGGELAIGTTICNEIRDHHQPVLIDDVAADETWRCHHTPAQYGFQSYISVPIKLPDGQFFGTLCSIDPKPRKVDTPEIRGMFVLFADLIAHHLDMEDRLKSSEHSLTEERGNTVLREQFIAVLGHDLRNPLSAIDAGMLMLAKGGLTPAQSHVFSLMSASTLRMNGLIDNVLDFARGRLGGGIALNRTASDIAPVLQQVIDELKSAHAERVIEVEMNLAAPVNCDAGRVAQLFSNLLANAITHGEAGVPIRVEARIVDKVFVLSVANASEPISPAIMSRLFQPFFRGDVTPAQGGLGLGLFIASEIARAHGGVLEVASLPEATTFTLRIPQIG